LPCWYVDARKLQSCFAYANHSGTGSVLDAIRIGVPVIVDQIATLLDNHQVEFAEQMAMMD
jgi:UDP-N-acetylglucosamine transferase subunit ALG13